MSKIKIKNFGPIKEGYQEREGWIDIKKVTIFIGNQGSGKSTVAKLIAVFSWIEKALTRGDYDIKWFVKKNKFRNTYCAYHRLESYFFNSKGEDVAQLEYRGNSYSMKYEKGHFSIQESHQGTYPLPQIMYVPAERNFISTIKSPKLLKLSSDSLVEFLTEFDQAKMKIKEYLPLPINNTTIEYNQLNDLLYINGADYKVRLTAASSGFQSVAPLYLVSWYLANSVRQKTDHHKAPMSSDELDRFKKGVAEIWSNEDLTDEQKRAALSVLSSKFNKTAFINIVEEPEQNLFPSSQRQILNSLLGFNNINTGNKLILTTHSPYIINYLSIAIQGNYVRNEMELSANHKVLLPKLHEIIPENALISDTDVAIYQLEEAQGSIKKLGNFEGIPSDENFLNQSLAKGNILFDTLLEIEQEL